MRREITVPAYTQTRSEELANALSHGLAALGAIVAIPVLVLNAVRDGGAAGIVGASVFGASMLLLYLTSTIYHGLANGKAKRVFMVLDHCAIYLLIAGTYTPFTLGVLRGSWGWSLFGVIWGLAIFGIAFKAVFGTRHEGISTVVYLLMGWLILIAVNPMLAAVPTPGLLWLLAGGIAYSVGVVFFILDDRCKYAHFIWHLFVVAGSSCHFLAVLWYAY